ncbi:MAG: asparagine synthase (glutamine-hydrolyzing) [Alphaproteobacteria bacterium]|nr:asparagine synthase (glutamine-hydrolyzing) [Alphaproteobacteria bacterium]
MCGIAGAVSLSGAPIERLDRRCRVMSGLIAHRGPDGEGAWTSARDDAGLVHRRLAIIDLSPGGAQPMQGPSGTVIAYNGEIYNHVELRRELAGRWQFRTESDTEVILAAYDRWGEDCVERLRGMFAFALWDERARTLFAARDRFGIKPLYYARNGCVFSFASEAKALLPFLDAIETAPAALAEYLTFQFAISQATLFRGIDALLPGHVLVVRDGAVTTRRYWDVTFAPDRGRDPRAVEERLRALLDDSLALHLRADVPIGAHVSGGLDSSLIALLASRAGPPGLLGFHGRFPGHPAHDESAYARAAAAAAGATLHVADIVAADFSARIGAVIHHLDFPVAGPGSFAQYMVAATAAKHRKAILAGQGGDELFGGYARYLAAYLEQGLKDAIHGSAGAGGISLASVLPNLGALREYTPLLQALWRDGLFEDAEARYLRLIDRSGDMADAIDWQALDKGVAIEAYRAAFRSGTGAGAPSLLDRMTRFDLNYALPALLHVEDRMGMAHGIESRVPFLDHPLVEFLATVPAEIKFPGGRLKHLLRSAYRDVLPASIAGRRDKMGFPVPLQEWCAGPLKGFMQDVLAQQRARRLPYLKAGAHGEGRGQGAPFTRQTWGLLSLELWHQRFHDRAAELRALAAA